MSFPNITVVRISIFPGRKCIPVQPARIFCHTTGDKAGTWLALLRSHSCSVSSFMVGSFSVLSSYVNGAVFIWSWKYVTSHAESNKQPVSFCFLFCRSLLGWISSSLQAPFCQRDRRQLSPAFLESPAWNRHLQLTGLTAGTQSSAHIALWPLCFSHWSDNLFGESEEPGWLKILLMGCWRSAYSFCRVMRELTVNSLLIILWLTLSDEGFSPPFCNVVKGRLVATEKKDQVTAVSSGRLWKLLQWSQSKFYLTEF